MTVEGANRLQDAFMGAVRGGPVTLFLANGVRLQGVVVADDRHTLLLVRDGAAQLVYKHAISTAVPVEPVALGASAPEGHPPE